MLIYQKCNKIVTKKVNNCKTVKIINFDANIECMLIRLKVFPKSRIEGLRETKSGKFELYIRAEAKRGEANMRVIEIMKEKFPNAKSVRIIKGHSSPNKHIEIGGVQEELGI